MTLEDALDIIDNELGSEIKYALEEGLPDGSYEEQGFDDQLIKDIASCVNRWTKRKKTGFRPTSNEDEDYE